MDKVYVIEFKAYHHYKDDDKKDYELHRVFGVFDTERRALCYLRRFYEADDIEYKGAYMNTVERKNDSSYADAQRWYDSGEQRITETLCMKPMEINDLRSPEDEIIDTYC